MASIAPPPAPVPSQSSETTEERRPQAGPLPRKRGEIGYQESSDGRDAEVASNGSVTPLPPRHPADRDPEVAPPAPDENEPSNPSLPNAEVPDAASQTNPLFSTSADASSTYKPSERTTFLSWLNPRLVLKRKKLGGVALGTILRLVLQLAFFAGTIALWIVVTKVLAVAPSNGGPAVSPAENGSSSDPPPKSGQVLGSSALIFLHVSFGIVSLVELLFLERCIFFIRAQRYAHMHHGASLPTHTRGGSGSGNGSPAVVTSLSMSLAPWSRPPLPTYAAALAQSGVGTGDVEDNLIAIAPPPAYGNTRDSTLLLAGFLPNNIRRSVSQYSSDRRLPSQASRPSRPASYRSHDEEWEQRCDAERALRLAETLDRLENSTHSPSASNRTTR